MGGLSGIHSARSTLLISTHTSMSSVIYLSFAMGKHTCSVCVVHHGALQLAAEHTFIHFSEDFRQPQGRCQGILHVPRFYIGCCFAECSCLISGFPRLLLLRGS